MPAAWGEQETQESVDVQGAAEAMPTVLPQQMPRVRVPAGMGGPGAQRNNPRVPPAVCPDGCRAANGPRVA